jgi:hypothetical protein
MGLDAIVLCNCWRDGCVRPPPVSRELIRVEASHLVLTLPYEGNEELTDAFERWKNADDLCEHGTLAAAAEWISNWGGVGSLRRAFESVGALHLPTLVGLLPTVNGGEVTPAEAQRALDEIPVFRERCRQVVWELVDELSAEPVARDLPAEGRHLMSGGGDPFVLCGGPMGLYFLRAPSSPGGAYPVGAEAPAEFCSAHFEQVTTEDGALYRDLASGATFHSRHVLGPRGAAGSLPGRYVVGERVMTAADFVDILGRLQTVLRGSVETGNSLYWQ